MHVLLRSLLEHEIPHKKNKGFQISIMIILNYLGILFVILLFFIDRSLIEFNSLGF